ncbi:MAG TPA: L,D-transpeptidase family protein [Mycobacteriales bacterium]|nr:L,D-transpeptidase family protein [Mycobacteriales bacterium]
MRRLTLLPALALASVSLACGNGDVRSAAPTSTSSSVASATPTSTSTVVAAAGSPVDHLRGVGSAQQVIEVAASRYGTSYATLTAYRKTASGWVKSYGPWTARVGRNGFAAPGKKHEGDGKTPTGSYGFGSFFFGVNSRPSEIRYSWRHAYAYDVWDDDSASARYNLWTNRNRNNPGRSPEPMHVSPAYNYGAVIAYNTARKPGLGSAIFLHVSHGSATAGCVAVPQSDVLKLLRWLNPRLSPRIIMGTTGAITK